MGKKNLIYIIGLAFVSCNLSRDRICKQDLLEYLNNSKNGLVKECTLSKISYKITFKPNDLIIDQDLKTNSKYNYDSLSVVYSDCLYFVLSLSRDSSEILNAASEDFTPLLNTISFGLGDKVILTDDNSNSEFYLSDFIYPRMYASSKSTAILLCFKNKDLKNIGNFTISIEDFVNNTDEGVKFIFSVKDIKNTPKLKYS